MAWWQAAACHSRDSCANAMTPVWHPNGSLEKCPDQHTSYVRYSNRSALGVDDSQRATFAILGGVGKRLTYEGCASA